VPRADAIDIVAESGEDRIPTPRRPAPPEPDLAFEASAVEPADAARNVGRTYAWVVFALTFGLLLSDYMSRQVLNAVFPLLKAEWALSDARLGLLGGSVAMMVGLLTFPLSLLADRWGRVRSITLMALLWSLATLACGLSRNYEQMLIARLCVGIGEAAYGSVGVAVVLSAFPERMRATITGAFMAGGMFGAVLGLAAGGVIAEHLGWRASFVGMALFGLVLAAMYPLVVKQSALAPAHASEKRDSEVPKGRSPLWSLIGTRAVLSAYVGSGLQLFIGASLVSWMPSYLNRYYHMGTDSAGALSAVLAVCSGTGMIVSGIVSDRLGRQSPVRKISFAIALCVSCSVLLSIAFRLPLGTTQLVLVGAGMFIAAGTAGPAGAMVANLTHRSIHGTAFATLTLANNLFGLATGPFLTGVMADRVGLRSALELVPLVGMLAAAAFLVARRYYQADLAAFRRSTLEPLR
jgi:MFS family permease